MTIKTLLFALFLYICLVWVGAFYWHSGPDIETFGLFWTGVGLLAVLAYIIFGRIFGWWRLRRADPRLARWPSPSRCSRFTRTTLPSRL